MKTSRLSTALFYFVNLAAVLYMYHIEVYGVNVSLVRDRVSSSGATCFSKLRFSSRTPGTLSFSLRPFCCCGRQKTFSGRAQTKSRFGRSGIMEA